MKQTLYSNIIKFDNKDLHFEIQKLFDKYEKMERILNDNNLNDVEKQNALESHYSDYQSTIKFINKKSPAFCLAYTKFIDLYKKELLILKKKKDRKSTQIQEILKLIDRIPDFTIHTLCDILSFKHSLESGDSILTSQIKELFLKSFRKQIIFQNYNYKIHKNINSFITGMNIKDTILLIIISHLLTLLQKADLINERDVYTSVYKKNYIFFSEELLHTSRYYIHNSNNYPMLIQPKLGEDRNYLYHTYKPTTKQDEPLIHYNQNKTKQTFISNNILNTIDYLQKQTFVINTTHLQFILNNLKTYLMKEEPDFDITIYKNRNDYLTQKIGKEEINSYKYNNIRQYYTKLYNSTLIKTSNFFNTVLLAILFQPFQFYYSVYLDSRTRLYYTGYLLEPQGTELARNLLTFQNHKDLISLDASASGFQIMGLLLQNDQYLALTKVMKSDTNEDFYEHYREKYNKKYKEPISYNTANFNFSSRIQAFYEKKEINVQIHDRKEFKFFALRFLYGQGKNKTQEQLKDRHPTFNKLDRIIYSELLWEFFKESFKDIDEFKQIGYEIVRLNENTPISLNNSKELHTSQFYVKQKTKRYVYKDAYGKTRTTTFLVDISPLEFDKKKNARALLANLCHSIDACILYRVVKRCEEQNIPIYTVHDCFIVPPQYQEKVLLAYRKVCIHVYYKDLITSFIETNLKNIPFDKSKKIRQYHKTFLEKRKLPNIYNFKKNCLDLSHFKL